MSKVAEKLVNCITMTAGFIFKQGSGSNVRSKQEIKDNLEFLGYMVDMMSVTPKAKTILKEKKTIEVHGNRVRFKGVVYDEVPATIDFYLYPERTTVEYAGSEWINFTIKLELRSV